MPVVSRLHRPLAPFPCGADLLISLTGFSDILGNRLDLYDTVTRFDDWMHLMNTGLITGGVVLLTTGPRASTAGIVVRALGIGMTLALGWEIYEYLAFVTRSPELPTGYADTIGDLGLGWLGSLLAGLLVVFARAKRDRHLRACDR